MLLERSYFAAGVVTSDHVVDDSSVTGFQFMTERWTGGIPRNWVLLDNQSTVDVFCNPDLISNMRNKGEAMLIHTNAGDTTTRMVGDLDGHGEVWYHPSGIANILSLSNVKKMYRVTFDSDQENQFIVHKPDGELWVFKESQSGLYYLEVEVIDQSGTTLVNTVADNASRYTNQEYSRATLARSGQRRAGKPTMANFKRYIEANLLPNCPFTAQDVQNAEDMFGKDVQALKGKMVRHAPHRVRPGVVSIPVEIMVCHKDFILAGDIMFVNRIPFFMTILRAIKFGTSEMIVNRKASTLLHSIEQIYGHYL